MKKGFRRWRGSVEDPIIIACGSGEGEWGRADTQACATFYSTLFVVRQVGEPRFKGFFLLFISTFSTFFSALFVVKKIVEVRFQGISPFLFYFFPYYFYFLVHIVCLETIGRAIFQRNVFFSIVYLLFLLPTPNCLSWDKWASHVSALGTTLNKRFPAKLPFNDGANDIFCMCRTLCI